MLGLISVFWGLCWASLLCAGAYAGPHCCVLVPMLGLLLLLWGLCWASFFCAGADAVPHVSVLVPMLGLFFVLVPMLGLIFLCWCRRRLLLFVVLFVFGV